MREDFVPESYYSQRISKLNIEKLNSTFPSCSLICSLYLAIINVSENKTNKESFIQRQDNSELSITTRTKTMESGHYHLIRCRENREMRNSLPGIESQGSVDQDIYSTSHRCFRTKSSKVGAIESFVRIKNPKSIHVCQSTAWQPCHT